MKPYSSEYQDYNNLPFWLPKKIAAIGLSNEQFAQKIGVSRTMVYEYLLDDARPGEQTALRMSRVLGVKFEELLSQYVPKVNGRHRKYGSTSELKVRKKK